MEIVAVTLDSKGQRYKNFLKNNFHLDINPFEAVVGKNLSEKEILDENLATSELISNKNVFSLGAMGCAASHKKIWKQCLDQKKSILVLEDDCYTHPQIKEFIAVNKKILDSCDMCYFGLHLNSVIQVQSPQGLLFSNIYFDPGYPNPDWIKKAFSKTDIAKVLFNKLIKGFGTWAYYITPKGAEKLINLIFPLSLETTKIPLIYHGKSVNMPIFSIDRAGCKIYKDINVLMTYPFLAYNENREISTTCHTTQ